MIKKLALLVASLLCCVQPSHAITIKKTPECLIVHESSGQGAVQNFLEDVLFLLPTQLSQLLTANFDLLYGSARISFPSNYWQHKVLDEGAFKQAYFSIAREYSGNRSDAYLARALGRSAADIIEVGSVANGFDPLNEHLRANITGFLSTAPTQTFLIESPIYRNHSFDAEVARLYTLRKYSKQNLYPELVRVTANLWTALWIATGHSDTVFPEVFVRRPFQLVTDMKAWRDVADREGMVTEIRDAKEAMIVFENLDNPYAIEGKLVSKRVEDNIRAQRLQQEAGFEYAQYKKAKGIRSDLLVIDTSDLAAAIRQQRLAEGNGNRSLTLDYGSVVAEKEKCDSLERCLLK